MNHKNKRLHQLHNQINNKNKIYFPMNLNNMKQFKIILVILIIIYINKFNKLLI